MTSSKHPVTRVLVVEDDANQAMLLSRYLYTRNYDVIVANTGKKALQELSNANVVVLDVNLPDMTGYDILAHIHENHIAIPVLMLSVLSETPYRVRGLKAGADDYLPKPYDLNELEARLEALLRRVGHNDQIVFEDLLIDRTDHRVVLRGELIKLSKLEFDFLWLMAQKPEKAFTREELLQHVWGSDFDGVERVVDVMVVSLRKKLGGKEMLETIRGVGYRFSPYV